MSDVSDRDIQRFFAGMKIMGPRMKKVAENEQARGKAGFRLLCAIARNMSIDVAKVFSECGYDPEIQNISMEEVERASREAGYETAKEFIADSESGENITSAKRLGYL